MGVGTVLTLLGQPPARRDQGLSDAAREAVVAAIPGEPAAPAASGIKGAATALRASLDQTAALTGGERLLMLEPLDRIANTE